MLTKVVDGVTYYCPRPQYLLSRLDASISQEGISLGTKTLLGREPARVYFDEDGRLWLSDFVSPEDLYAKMVEDPKWFPTRVNERDITFRRLKNTLKSLIPSLKSHSLETPELVNCLETLIGLQTAFLSFVYLPLVDEYLAGRLRELVARFLGDDLAQEYMFSLLKPPTYFQEAIRSRVVFSERKTLEIPPCLEPFFVDGEIDWELGVLPYDAQITGCFPEYVVSDGFDDITEFARLRAIVPVLFQIGQEDLFIGKAIIVALSNCIYDISCALVDRAKLGRVTEVLNLDAGELLDHARNI